MNVLRAARLAARPRLFIRQAEHALQVRKRRRALRRNYSCISTVEGPISFSPPTVELSQAKALPDALRRSAEIVVAEAVDASARRFDILGSGATDVGRPIDWHRDAKSGYRWPAVFYQDVEITRLDDRSDAKWPWELSRCHHFVTLARAAVLNDDPGFATELNEQFVEWLEANPSGYGINWTNAMEIAIRAVNWIWALATVEQTFPVDPITRDRVLRSLVVHGRHIAANLEGSPYLRGNHYLADLLGLLAIGSCVDCAEGAQWVQFAASELEREIYLQTSEDGVGFEASLSYHALSLEMFCVALFLARHAGVEIGGGYVERVSQMIDVLLAVRHPSGRVPLFGDGDSGRIVPGAATRDPNSDAVLWVASVILGRGRLLTGTVHPEVAWTLGIPAWLLAANLSEEPPEQRSEAFPAGGIYVMRSKRAHVVVRTGDVGQNGQGGHAHNDALSFELSLDGSPLVVDSGTYAYTSDVAARNLFRSTAAHNVVTVDGVEYNPIPDEVFRLPQRAKVVVEVWASNERRDRLEAWHDAYDRLRPPVICRRHFELDKETSVLTVIDLIEGVGVREVVSRLHFSPAASVTPAGSASILCTGAVAARVDFEAGSPKVVEGTVSDRFGVREPAPTVIHRALVELPTRFVMQFVPCSTGRGVSAE